MGCIARLGCLVILVLLAIIAWLTRDRWMEYLHTAPPPAVVVRVDWQPLTVSGAERAQAALDSLDRVRGPVFQNVSAADASAYVTNALFGRLPSPADSAEAAVIGNELHVRAKVRLRDLGGSAVLGPLASMLNERERIELGGTFRVVRPGLTDYQVRQIRLGRFGVPSAVIPKLLSHLAKNAGLDSVKANALPIPTPKYLVDIRVTHGHLTLYKGLK